MKQQQQQQQQQQLVGNVIIRCCCCCSTSSFSIVNLSPMRTSITASSIVGCSASSEIVRESLQQNANLTVRDQRNRTVDALSYSDVYIMAYNDHNSYYSLDVTGAQAASPRALSLTIQLKVKPEFIQADRKATRNAGPNPRNYAHTLIVLLLAFSKIATN
ncbi:hypothetical protein T4D_12839 [Trichinella pseudospiralis]|uniref:Uncharacterized protein n=1 Tax=Trichinella pseudospiralis TaxID=6337 RepID=A0A0V1FVZ0_TRIPS|nr:hypothetical protein T4D_12839 [Trichinella pseudospiralis]